MVYDIIVGRNEDDRKKFGEKGTIFIGKQFVQMGQTTSLSNNMFLDVVRPHVLLVSGKRGSGKSYSLSVIAEEMTRLPEEIKKNMAILFFDTMGIFWTMNYPNDRQSHILEEWDLKPEGMNINIFTPSGYFKEYKEKGIPTDFEFRIKTSELNSGDWCNLFDVKLTDPIGVLIERIIEHLQDEDLNYDISDIIDLIKEDKKTSQDVKNATENRFLAAATWGLFSNEGTEIKDLLKPGEVSVLDISCYTNVSGSWSIKALVIGIISQKLLNERIGVRKYEELYEIKTGEKLFSEEKQEEQMPMVWLLIDEAHEFLPKEGSTPATDALVQLLREGRQPGISLILATQQPGQIHKDVLTQSDIVLSHRLTAKIDIEALNSMMQTYLVTDIQAYLNTLPKQKGAAIILDDNSERIYPVQIHPKRSWHGGEAPTAIKKQKKLLDLGF